MAEKRIRVKGQELLEKYLQNSTLRRTAFAEACGMSPTLLSHIISGERRTKLTAAVLIARLSGGAVPIESWAEI